METITGLFLEGFSVAERERLQQRLEHRQFPEGSVILGEGDAPREVYIIESGLVDVFIAGLTNVEHRISTLGPGDSMGEMSVLTGQPVSATVRAATVVDVLVLPETALDATFAEFPQLYRNLGSILSARLARTSRRLVQRQRGRANLLVNHGAPPLMGYALASSVAWHTRASTLHVVWSGEEFDPELRAIAESRPVIDDATALPWTSLDGARDERPRAELMLARMEGEFAPDRLHRTVELLCERYAHVLIEVCGGETRIDIPARTISLLGPTERLAAPASGDGGFALRGWVEPPERIGPDPTRVVNVPASDDSERSSIVDGRLPLGGPTGKAIGWAARDLTNQKVGVALGGGAIKGYAHVGVLHALERWGVPIDYIAGTSIGAAVGAMYAAGFPPETCHRHLKRFGAGVFRLAWPRHALLSNTRVRKAVHGVADERQIEKLAIPLSIVAADLTTGREVVFDRGLLWPAVLASMAIPGIFPPVRIGEYTLVDGGVVNPVPSNTVSGMGADIVLAVKLSRRGAEAPLNLDAATPSGGLPLIIQTLARSIEIMQGKIVTDSAAVATITMEPMFPDLTGWGLRQFGDADSFVEVGEAAAESARPRVSAVLPWLRS